MTQEEKEREFAFDLPRIPENDFLFRSKYEKEEEEELKEQERKKNAAGQ